MIPRQIRNIIFDFDGLLIETEEIAFNCVRDMFWSYGVDLPFSLWSQVIGGSGGTSGGSDVIDVYDYLEEKLGTVIDRASVRSVVRSRQQKLADELPLLPGVTEYISEGSLLGLKLAVASSSSGEWVNRQLERRGLLNLFEVIVTRDDVARPKPEPDIFNLVLEKLKCEPEECIALEDSPNGVTAANRAGIFSVAIPNVMTKSLPLEHARIMLNSLSDIPLSTLLGNVSSILVKEGDYLY